jgi:hypothetical protein
MHAVVEFPGLLPRSATQEETSIYRSFRPCDEVEVRKVTAREWAQPSVADCGWLIGFGGRRPALRASR